MEQSVHGIVLDLRDIHNPRHLDVKQGDTGVRLCVVLTDGGKPYRLTPDCYGVFTAKKPDGTCIFNRCTTENGRLVYDFTPQTTAAPGDLDCQLKLYGKNDRLLTTAAFTVTVHETVYNEGDTLASETEVTALTRLISQTTDLVDTVQTKLDTGEFHGKTPHIGENGNWFLGETDTGIAAGTLDDSRVSEATTWSSRKLQDAIKDFVKLETAPVVRYRPELPEAILERPSKALRGMWFPGARISTKTTLLRMTKCIIQTHFCGALSKMTNHRFCVFSAQEEKIILRLTSTGIITNPVTIPFSGALPPAEMTTMR